jgi:hypothetical protein
MDVVEVAALFVDRCGPYRDIPYVEMWDETKDARKYKGPYPVVAHPPCNRWGKMAPVNLKRWGTPIGEDGGCFESALESLFTFGGVLEHPAQSLAWPKFNLQKPKKGGWLKINKVAWVGEVRQSDYGHPATKKTWLLYVGNKPPEPYLETGSVGEFQVGGGVNTGNNKKPRLNQSLSHLTPPKFAEYLVKIAKESDYG